MGNMPNAREIASLVWLVAVLGFLLTKPSARDAMRAIGRAFWTPKVVTPVAAYFAYVAALVLGAARLGLWDGAMLKDTLIWALGPALVLFFRTTNAGKESHFFRRTALGVVEVAALIGFWTNLFVLPLVVELILVPFLTLLGMMAAYAAVKPEHQVVARAAKGTLAAVGLSLLVYALYRTIMGWPGLEWPALTRTLLLPAWLTVSVLPFIAVLALVMVYGTAFSRVNVMTADVGCRRRAKAALLAGLHVRVRRVGTIGHEHLRNAVHARSFREAWLVARRARLS